ncbi:hypothetical protein J2Y69_000198 [Microbacterium resistens]|uniref:Uncharacterized protein n=1 Tax=Microbacterium resistens TaxID=156977 RepID=A0ABU1S7M0_9MICO|nr:hypothetical protein [Microbacterium resistens]MDR6865616.1 hypothetical protein [Microbacterium resistens]
MIDALLRAAVSPSPTPTVDPELVTPGPIGFGIMAVLVVGVVLLIWDMQRRIRRVRYREEVRAELDAEELAGRAAAPGDPGSPARPAPDPDETPGAPGGVAPNPPRR